MSKFWEENVPWSFRDVNPRPSLSERIAMRYKLEDYLHDTVRFYTYSGKRVLDYGCGSGLNALEFATYGADVFCMDTSRNAVKETEQAFKEAGLTAKQIVQGDIRDVHFKGIRFDLIFSFGVLHHIPDVGEVLESILDALKFGGEFIGMFYNKDSILYSYSMAHGITIERVPNVPYVHPYTKDQLSGLLHQYFSKVQISTHYNVIDLPDRRKVKLNIPDSLGLGWHHIARCMK